MRDDFFLPPAYLFLSDAEASRRVREHKRRLGPRLVLVAHAYQRPAIQDLADVVGDGVALARWAASAPATDFVVCASVRYVAENARVLLCERAPRVFATDADAGCPMAEGIAPAVLAEALSAARSLGPAVPVGSVTLAPALLAACGRAGGSACGASNAGPVLRWALGTARRAIFLPDASLASYAAGRANVPPGAVRPWSPSAPIDDSARVLVLAHPCPVHERFSPLQVAAVREREAGVCVVVQPDAPPDVRAAADAVVPVGAIRAFVDRLPPGTPVALGTELQVVEQLRAERPERPVSALETTFCASHYTPSLASLLHLLDHLDEAPAIEVPEDEVEGARCALERMLALDR